MSEFAKLVDDIAATIRQRDARNRRIRDERDRRLAGLALWNEMELLHDRMRRPNPAFAKCLRDVEVMAKAHVLDGGHDDAKIAAAAAQRANDQRNAAAVKLKGILDRLDAAILAGTIDADGVAKIEARVNRLAERIMASR